MDELCDTLVDTLVQDEDEPCDAHAGASGESHVDYNSQQLWSAMRGEVPNWVLSSPIQAVPTTLRLKG